MTKVTLTALLATAAAGWGTTAIVSAARRLSALHVDSIGRFASLTDRGAEGTGIYSGKDPKTLIVNVQHSVHDDGDGARAITNR